MRKVSKVMAQGFWKEMKSDTRYLILVLIGILLTAFDQHIVCSFLNGIYPAFVQSADINEAFQFYTMNDIFGMKANIYQYSIGEITYNLKVDIFPDLAGYLLIAFGLFKLSKKTKIYNLSATTAVIACVLYVCVRLLPFVFNGQQLVYICFMLIIAQFGMEICITYMFMYGTCQLLPGYAFAQSRRAIGISWFVTIILNTVILVISWMAVMLNPIFLTVYNMLDLGVNLLFVYFVFKDRDYILGYKKA